MLSMCTALIRIPQACHLRAVVRRSAGLFTRALVPARTVLLLCLCLFTLQCLVAQQESALAAQSPSAQQQEKPRNTSQKPAASRKAIPAKESQAKPATGVQQGKQSATAAKPTPKNAEKRTPPASKQASAKATEKTETKAPAKAETAANAATSPKALKAVQGLQAEFNAIANDAQRASFRHNWLNFEKRINTLLERYPNQPEAMLLAARTLEELAVRARTPQDWREAAQRYDAFADKHGKHALAAEARLKQATFLSRVPGAQDDAKRAIRLVQRDYPQSKQATQAAALLKELEAQPPQAAPTKEVASKESAKEARENTKTKEATPPAKGGKTAEKPGRTGEKPSRTKDKTTNTNQKGTLAQQLGLTVRTIMLDPGHGGKDPGTTANSIQESLFTMQMAKKVSAALEAQGFTVILTRAKDSYISLQDRPLMANAQKADLFISLHANANANPEIQGLETYYLDSAKSKDAALAAARENGIDVEGVSDLQFILSDLTGNSKRDESRKLASLVQKEILKRAANGKQPMVDNGVRSAPFYVLMGAKMPAILVEFGYVTNTNDAASLSSDRFLQLQAAGLADAVSAYKRAVEK